MNRDEIDELDEVLDDIEEKEVGDENTKTLEESIRRIELANLYLAIVKTDVFSAESGSADSVTQANREFKRFAVERINALLGIEQPSVVVATKPVDLPFDDSEVLALKALAAKVLRRDMSTLASEIKRPVIQTVGSEAINTPIPEVKSMSAPKPIIQGAAIQNTSTTSTTKKTGKKVKQSTGENDKLHIAPGSKTPKGNVRTAAGYAVPPNYSPNLGAAPIISQSNRSVGNAADLGLNITSLVNQAVGGQQSVVTLSDQIEGGDPNERI
jgi:hypothetical protein